MIPLVGFMVYKGPSWSPPPVLSFCFSVLFVVALGAEITRRVLSFFNAASNLADSVTTTDVRRTAAVFCEVAAVACIFLVFTGHRTLVLSLVGIFGLVGALLALPEMKDQFREVWAQFSGDQ